MSTLLALLGDPTIERRPTHAQVCAALQTEIDRCKARLAEPCSSACGKAYSDQMAAARRLLSCIAPDQGRLL